MTLATLPLYALHERHSGLTPAVATSYLEAARVCLDQHHTSPQEFGLNDGGSETNTIVEWELTDERTRKAWANQNDATRDGAYALALAATELTRDLVAIGRAETLTGADYYIGPADQALEDFENCYRLEVSGTHLDVSSVRTRLREKVQQAREGASNLPAIACVVGFRVRLVLIQTVE